MGQLIKTYGFSKISFPISNYFSNRNGSEFVESGRVTLQLSAAIIFSSTDINHSALVANLFVPAAGMLEEKDEYGRISGSVAASAAESVEGDEIGG